MVSDRILLLIANIVFGIVEGVIGLRVILKLFGANPIAPFVSWIYAVSQPLLAPFFGMFPTPLLRRGGTIEFSALFALLIYAFLGNVIEKAIIYFQHSHSNS